jgi:uncharacterized protein
MKRIAIVAGLLLAAAAVAGVLRPEGAAAVDPPVAQPDTVTVSGIGTVSSVPDEAQVSVGVESQGQTAQAALAANARDMRKVIDAVRAAGGKDVTTQTVSLSPRMTSEGQADGFTATNVVGATIGLANAGKLIDAAVEAGANTIYGPSLSSSDAEKLYNDALKKAVADARERAETLAAAASRQVGRVMTMSEGGGGAIPFAEKAAAADAGTPVVSGPQETTASVSVTFELR